ncbi:MAG: ATP-binding cassette domain-containing protein [Erysipelotrichaceae bacterium]|nr:ATP-binding cassette domain-containing protein [Erysipelotrichaceae bacterium]
MIEFKNVSKKYKNGTHALENVNLKVEDGEFVYIMGPTGSGKSTLIKLLDGEEVPTGGSVIVNNVNVGRLRKSKVYLYRRKIGVVFQDYRLLPEKTVFENVAYALEVLDMPGDKIKKRTREVLKLVDLADKSNVKPRELSGGQQQRVAIARAIAKRPAILIADEPTGNLDPSMTDEMITLLEKINREEKTTLLVVTHNDVMVEYHPKRTIRIDSGHIVNDGTHGERFYKQNFGEVKKPQEENKEEKVEVVSETPVQEEEAHTEHIPTEREVQDQKIEEINQTLESIEEIKGGDGI